MFRRFTSTLVFAGGLLLCAPVVRAQHSLAIGPRLGLNLATYHYPEKTPVGTPGYRAGLEAGVAGAWGRGHFAVQAAALYSQKGFAQHYTVELRTAPNLPGIPAEVETSNRLDYLTVPLSVAFTQGNDGQGAQVFAGPYVGLLLGGRYETKAVPQSGAPTSDSGSITPTGNEVPDLDRGYTRRFDAGLQAGVGYRYRAWMLQLAYSVGLRNLSPSYHYNGVPVSTPAYYNRAFQGSLTYLFGPAQ
ncbi:porin family protein [Hymenobacter ruricola]|uniref:PorT family protein n=1 Tax=Hymenobacter ruricola TaxID=2791023 RepID=A0ABS0I5I3_9BACT|nr:porin family protein [Hymenobacter ruricola]MBF9222220.1 PorT family protein [Hymenobacter ruricola]